jgi:hypothetical protein
MAIATYSYADTSAEAIASVYATVNPNVSMSANTAIVNAGTVQTGDFSAVINFRVDANKEQVQLCVEASPLFKGDVVLNPEVPPIPLNLSAGVTIAPASANPVNAGTNVAVYTGAGNPILGYPSEATECILFESSQAGRFSQDVLVTVTWTQSDPEKPMGQYSGKVRLLAALLP